jgi:hypothetical protein
LALFLNLVPAASRLGCFANVSFRRQRQRRLIKSRSLRVPEIE